MEGTVIFRRPGNPRSQAFLLIAEVCIPLFLVVGLEAGFRWYVGRTPALPLPKLFPSPFVTAKYLAFREAATQPEPIDVIVMGLSPMMVVSSQRLHDFLRAGGYDVGVFNFASPFSSLTFDRSLLHDIVLKMRKPKLLVYGLMPFNLLYEPARRLPGRYRGLPGFELHEDTLTAPLRAAVLTHVNLLLYRDVIRDMLVPWGEPQVDPWAENARLVNRMGDVPRLEERPPPQQLPQWEVNIYSRQMKRVEPAMRSGVLFREIGAMGDFCREQGMRLAVVNSTVSPFFVELLPGGRKQYDEFVRRAREAAAAAGAPFLDLSGPNLGAPDSFVDTHHHNQAGAIWMTEQIGAFLMGERLLEAPSVARVGS